VAVEPWGTFQISEAVRWPADVAHAIYGNGTLWPWIVNFNGPHMTMDNWQTTWPAVGGKVKAPPLPAAVGAKKGHEIAGVRVQVPGGAAPAAIVGVAFPNESFAQRSARVPTLDFWNAGPREYKAGEVLFVQA
jgi:hypothetical protein